MANIGAQLYTVRDHLQTKEDVDKTFRKLREIGSECVQVSGLKYYDPQQIRDLCDELGMVVCGTHIPFERMRDDFDAVIAEHKLMKSERIGIGGLSGEYRDSAEGYIRFAKEANEVAKKLAAEGFPFTYHNHAFEFQKFGDKTGFELLVENCDPQYVEFLLDTYWLQVGGNDIDYWIDRLAGQLGIVHFKDMTANGNASIMAEVGEGNMNWPKIIDECKAAGAKWYVIEQDTCQRDSLESIAISYNNLKKMGLE